MALKFTFLKLQWNPVNPVTNRPQTFGRINGVAVLKGFSKYENDWLAFARARIKWRNNEVTVLTGW